jgi:shikimate dehydrogenase
VRQNSTIVVNATSSGLFPDTNDRLDIDVDSLQPHLIVADVIPNPPRKDALQRQ